MTKLFLLRGDFTLIDDEDADLFSKWVWHKNGQGHVARGQRIEGKYVLYYLHREIMRAPNDQEIDHINGNKLDNRKNNLRLCNSSENGRNRGKQINNSSGFKGVSYYKKRNKWNAQIILNKKKTNLGYYGTPEEAAIAYNNKAKSLHGSFANFNAL